MAALGAEAVWTRLISLSLGGPVYAFSILLGVFLAGLVLGSFPRSKLVEYRITAQRAALGLVQFLLVPAIFLAALTVTRIVPALSAASPQGALRVFLVDIFCCLIAVFPVAFFWGASFPLTLASTSCFNNDLGRLGGKMDAANTAGAIAGSLFFSLVSLPRWGLALSQRLFIILPLVGGLFAWLPFWKKMVFSA